MVEVGGDKVDGDKIDKGGYSFSQQKFRMRSRLLALRSRSLPGDPRSAPRRPGWAIPGLFGRPTEPTSWSVFVGSVGYFLAAGETCAAALP